MNGGIMDWLLSNGLLQWFATTLVQVTLLAGLGLFATGCMPQPAVVRHSLLTIVLVLIVTAPMSTWCLQRSGYGVITIAAQGGYAANENAEPTTETRYPKVVGAQMSGDSSGVFDVDRSDPQTGPGKRRSPEAFNDETNEQRLARCDAQDVDSSPQQTAKISDADLSGAAPTDSLQEPTRIAENGQLWRSLLSLICVVWLAGCIASAVRWLVAWLRLLRLIAQSQTLESGDAEAAYLTACGLVGCGPQAVRVAISTSVATPVVAGVIRPTIVLPVTLICGVSKQQLVEIFIHELAHVVRRDPLVLVVQQFARACFWAHPLVEHVNRRLTQSSEEICDNYVLTQSVTTSYSHTLLTVAELTVKQCNPIGTIGVVGGDWSLAERIAGLLDHRRERMTRLRGRSRAVVAVLAACFSIVLLLTFRFTTEVASAQTPIELDPSPRAESSDWLRGKGDQLEFRLHGRLLVHDGGPLVNPAVSVRETTSKMEYRAKVVGESYEVWLPAKALRFFALTLAATSDDGYLGGAVIEAHRLRMVIREGTDIVLRRPSRSVEVLVRHGDQPVPGAKVLVRTAGSAGSRETLMQSDERGKANVGLNAGEVLESMTAWTDSGMLGGYQFNRGPERYPNASEHVVELIECQRRTVHVVDANGSPVGGVRLKLQVATPPPHINHFGNPTDSELITDRTGTATFRWFPKMENAHSYAELTDESEWILQSERSTEEAVEIVVARPTERVRVEGTVSRGGQNVAGVMVKAGSFQSDREGKMDNRFSMTDVDGKFSFEVLPSSTYSLLALDEQWVSEPSVFVPVDPESGEKKSLHVTVVEGYPVTIQLTAGRNRNPIAGQPVSLQSEFQYSWEENGQKQNGITARVVNVTTDEYGLATALVPLGKLKASVFRNRWETVVTEGNHNRLEINRPFEIATQVSGRLVVPPTGTVDFKKANVFIQSMDGESEYEFTPVVDEFGYFEFQTRATAIGCFAYSDDGMLAAATFVDDLSQPFDLKLVPSAYLRGQLLDGQGKPIANHLIFAQPSIANPGMQPGPDRLLEVTKGRAATTKTDANGNYRLGPLPRLAKFHLFCEASESEGDFGRQDLGEYYLELGEERPPQLHRIGPAPGEASPLTP